MELIRVNIQTGEIITNNLHLLEKFSQPEDGEQKVIKQYEDHLRLEQWLAEIREAKRDIEEKHKEKKKIEKENQSKPENRYIRSGGVW